jgi:choline-sulfatase
VEFDMANPSDRPNIIFMLADDMGPWAMGCAGNAEIRTPNLDRLAASGMRHENFFCASPVCSPARATLITGRIPSQHGVHDWLAAGNTTTGNEGQRGVGLIEYLKDQPGYTDFLAAAGYRCGLSGKWHIGDCHHAQKSFEFWEVHAQGGGNYYNAPMLHQGQVIQDPRYVTEAITSNALDWLEASKGRTEPFYLSVHYTAPHSPWDREQHPQELFDDYFANCPFDSVPWGLTPAPWVQFRAIPVPNEERRRTVLSGYFAAITAMDQQIGRLLDWLEDNDLTERTLVIFSSDNGMNMGHHGVFGKGNATFPLNMYDEAVKVPFIASHPGTIAAGTSSRALLSQYDFLPTLLEYAGVANPEAPGLPGRSFAGLLRGQAAGGTEAVVVCDEYGPVRMLRTATHKYIHRLPYGPHELYNLAADPEEAKNLIGQPEHLAVENDLRERLRTWFHRWVDPARDGAMEPVTGAGQMGLCGLAAQGRQVFSQLRLPPPAKPAGGA